jgi:hypothetical protein
MYAYPFEYTVELSLIMLLFLLQSTIRCLGDTLIPIRVLRIILTTVFFATGLVSFLSHSLLCDGFFITAF